MPLKQLSFNSKKNKLKTTFFNHRTVFIELIHENVKKEYGLIAEENPVAFYNNNRLYKS
jgi:hypothetical protein